MALGLQCIPNATKVPGSILYIYIYIWVRWERGQVGISESSSGGSGGNLEIRKSANLEMGKSAYIYTLLVGVWGLTLRSAHSYFLVAQILSLKLRMTEPSRLEVSPGSMHKKTTP